jgi:SAM-dependent methyltransferase
VLVAGGGTGDSTIYLAEQLHGRGGEVVYVDISKASMEVAQARAAVRKLDNIRWINDSLLTLTPETIGEFDYISCTGVLHHLSDPLSGLRALKSVLKPIGGMGILLYGKYGRTGVYQLQKLMRLINGQDGSMEEKVATTRMVLAQMPESNWFKHNERYLSDHRKLGDSGLYDLLLHEQDVAFSVDEVYRLLGSAGLHLTEFCDVKLRLAYQPAQYVRNAELAQKISRLDLVTQQSVAELMVGLFTKHVFYLSNRPDARAKPGALTDVPFFFPDAQYKGLGPQLGYAALRRGNHILAVRHESGFEFDLALDPVAAAILKGVDGANDWRTIFAGVRAELEGEHRSDEDLLEHFRPVFEQLRQYDWLLLRGPHVGAFPDTRFLQAASERR